MKGTLALTKLLVVDVIDAVEDVRFEGLNHLQQVRRIVDAELLVDHEVGFNVAKMKTGKVTIGQVIVR